MAVIVLASAAGAPGVTSTAIGMALTWKRSVILVDADPGAHQSILAGYLRGQISTGKGMQRVAEAHRDRRPLAEVVSDETIPLADCPAPSSAQNASSGPDGDSSAKSSGLSRRLLPGFRKPANAALFEPVWPDLTDTFVRYEAVGIDVIVDAGRLDPRAGLPQPVVDRADAVCVVTRSDLRAIAATRGAVLRLREQVRLSGNDSNLGLVLLGENDPYGRREIGNLLGVPVLSVVAADPQNARVFSDGARRSRKFDRSDLVRSLHRTGDDLMAQVRRRRSRLGLDPDSPRPDSPRPDSPHPNGQGPDRQADDRDAGYRPAAIDLADGQPSTAAPAMNAWLRAGSNDAGGAADA